MVTRATLGTVAGAVAGPVAGAVLAAVAVVFDAAEVELDWPVAMGCAESSDPQAPAMTTASTARLFGQAFITASFNQETLLS
jgi:hypothetical protein